MYPIAVVGSNSTARAAILACRQAGFENITWVQANSRPSLPATTLPANLTRVISALGGAQRLARYGHQPDREQIRFATSGYLLSELPLGKFAEDRYGAPHINIESADLARVLELTESPDKNSPVEELARNHNAVLVCTSTDQASGAPTRDLWHAKLPISSRSSTKANITWLAPQQTAWQFSTPHHTHYLFSTAAGASLNAAFWHADLHEAIAAASLLTSFDTTCNAVREHWYEGNIAYLGEACYTANVYRREALELGLEDAWVLSRMLENYEEDTADGLAAYAKYRRPRARRIAQEVTATVKQHNALSPMGRLGRNINIAFSTRFIPEIAMQRIDWHYDYDCIRGFR